MVFTRQEWSLCFKVLRKYNNSNKNPENLQYGADEALKAENIYFRVLNGK